MNSGIMNYKTYLLASICLFMVGIMIGFVLFPKFLKSSIKSNMHVAKGSKMRPFYEKTPIFLDFLVYIFNVTNKDDFIQGKKPRLQEIGPYFFEEWKEKFDLVDDEDEDTVTYHYRNKFVFRQDLSGGLTGDEIIVVPHPLLMGALLATNVDKQPMLSMVEGGMKSLFNDPPDTFFTGRVMDLLYDGILVDCTKTDQVATALCLNFENEKAFKKLDNGFMKFSMFGGVNYTDMGEMKVYRGKKNYKDLGRLIAFNGDTGQLKFMDFYSKFTHDKMKICKNYWEIHFSLDVDTSVEGDAWDGEECNQFFGTDSTIVPPLLDTADGIWGYDPSVCRAMGVEYVNKKTKYNGIPVYIYELNISSPANTKQCFCRDEDNCPPHGTFDMFRCSGIPMYGSLPHFYDAEQLLSGIESGLHPNKEAHGLQVYVEILTGAGLMAAKRMQFNLEVKPIPEIEWMKNMPEVILPLFWVQEGVALDKEMTDQMKTLFLLVSGAWIIMADE